MTDEQRALIRETIRRLEGMLEEVDDPPKDHYQYAASLIGLAEIPGAESDPQILAMIRQWLPAAGDDSTISWCGAFVAHVLDKFGYRVAETPLVARSWRNIYPAVDLDDARKGDVAVLWRDSPSSWKGHVGFYESHTGTHIRILGGNQSNSVSVAAYPRHRLLGVYRPL